LPLEGLGGPLDGLPQTRRTDCAVKAGARTRVRSRTCLRCKTSVGGEDVKIDRRLLEEYGRGGAAAEVATVFEATTQTTGRVRVVDYRNERR